MPRRVQICRREWVRWLVVAYLVFSPVGGAVVFLPDWLESLTVPLLHFGPL
ncbi:hypothetical protein [Nonomuraea angiospora]|uniref:hypothetical protein n=1 Tax=Nonomuraea angiospora TaxID=46172 RepID=UPI0029A4E4EC|nr:hypothetical protein [Nonomuraea angiospora]MDX3106712.1 hypothetical protein [Nonomuraea angiospora]